MDGYRTDEEIFEETRQRLLDQDRLSSPEPLAEPEQAGGMSLPAQEALAKLYETGAGLEAPSYGEPRGLDRPDHGEIARADAVRPEPEMPESGYDAARRKGARRWNRRGRWATGIGAALAAWGGHPEIAQSIAQRGEEAARKPVQDYLRKKALERQALQDKRAGEAHGVQMDQARGAMAEKAAASDPSSPVNQVMQEAMRERFPGMVSDDLLARMTVANPTAMKLLESKGVTLEQLQAAADKRAAETEDWRFKEDYKLKGKKEFEDYASRRRMMEAAVHGRGLREGMRAAGEEVPQGVSFAPDADVDTPLNALQQSYIDRGRQAHLDDDPEKWKRYVALVRQFTPERQTRGEIGKRLESSMDSLITQGEQNIDVEQRQVIPGWERTENAPELTPDKAEKARAIAAAQNRIQRLTNRLLELREKMTAADALGGAIGLDSALMAEARSIQDDIAAQVRQINNFGVPSGKEMELAEQKVPRFDTLTGFISGVNRYRGLLSRVNISTEAALETYGYRRSKSRPSVGGARRGRRKEGGGVTIRAADGRVFRDVTPEQLEALKAKGAQFEVVQ